MAGWVWMDEAIDGDQELLGSKNEGLGHFMVNFGGHLVDNVNLRYEIVNDNSEKLSI